MSGWLDFRQSLSSAFMLCAGIEDLCSKRDELHRQIVIEDEEKSKIQNDLRILTERLARVNESLAKKIAARTEYDRTIAETEAAYMKVKHEVSPCRLRSCFVISNCH